MSYQVILAQAAKDDLAIIYRYIAVELQSVQNANRLLNRLEAEIFSLDEMPERFRAYNHAKWREHNLRIMPVDHYLVFFIPQKEKKTVTIMRVLYGGRDIDRVLGEP